MMRRTGLALAWLGLSAATMVLSLSACYVDLTQDKKGTCEDDGNPCTEDACTSGPTDHRPKNDGEVCTLGTNTGTCQKGDCTLACGHPGEPDCACASDGDCQLDTECSNWSCDTASKKCVNAMTPDNTEVGTPVPGDCQKLVCRDGLAEPQPTPNDLPPNVVGDCKQFYCDNISPKTMNDPTDTPADKPGDCNKYTCVDGAAVEVPDDNDKPAPTDCVTNSCVGGVITPLKDPPGTACMNKMRACNTEGMCADCLSASEIIACNTLNLGNCPVKKCDGQACNIGTECKNNTCADGVCCATSCSDICKSCAVAGSEGTCSNIPYYQTDSAPTVCDYDTNGSYCDGKGQCLRAGEIACNTGAQCISGVCMANKCVGATGEVCSGNSNCISMMCVMGACK